MKNKHYCCPEVQFVMFENHLMDTVSYENNGDAGAKNGFITDDKEETPSFWNYNNN